MEENYSQARKENDTIQYLLAHSAEPIPVEKQQTGESYPCKLGETYLLTQLRSGLQIRELGTRTLNPILDLSGTLPSIND